MRTINEVAYEIKRVWKKPSIHARPYLNAMCQVHDGMYGHDDARGIVCYFLSNASGFRGADARRLKKELKQICNIK